MDLGINIDHVATLRQARGTVYPNLVTAARTAEEAGADLITLHLREDRRHIVDRDVEELRESIETRMNLEIAATTEMVMIACRIRPDDVCLVPERREELTTEGGLEVAQQKKKLLPMISFLRDAGIRVSMFVDPDRRQIDASSFVGADAIEIHTGAYSEAAGIDHIDQEFYKVIAAVSAGKECGLRVNAGHGLHYENVQRIAGIRGIEELNIGHSIIAQAVFSGLSIAVKDMKHLIEKSAK